MKDKSLIEILYAPSKNDINFNDIDSVHTAKREIEKVKQKAKTLDYMPNNSQIRSEKMKARLRIKLAERELEKQNKTVKRKW